MADLRDYKNKDFSITVNSRMKGIELRFENTMTEEQIEQIKEAGFRWSKRQQMWYAYQNEKTIAYAKSLEYQYEDKLENNEIKQEKAERVTGTWNKEEYEIKADKAQARREADEKRMARSETADKLFDKYLHEGLSEDLSKRVEAEYNRRFNSYVIPDYSKLPLFIDGMSRTKNGKRFKLYDQQIKGVSFLCNKGKPYIYQRQ